MEKYIIWLLPLPPLLAFLVILLFTNKHRALSHSIAIGAAALSWLGSMILFIRAIGVEEFGKHVFGSSINWIPTGPLWLTIGVQIDPLSAVVVFFVAWTVLAIFVYSIGYHNYGQPEGDHDVFHLMEQRSRCMEKNTRSLPSNRCTLVSLHLSACLHLVCIPW
jgi:NADH-quinone oxidoreductase subunit L